MPFTPFHFGPSGAASLPLARYIDVPVFVTVNVVVDIEPLLVMVYALDYPLHGYCHTLLVGSLVGVVWGCLAWYMLRPLIRLGMKVLHLGYETGLVKMLLSSAAGVWLHVLLDSVMHADVRPFYPLGVNPFYRLVGLRTLHLFCLACLVPVLAIYICMARRLDRERASMESE